MSYSCDGHSLNHVNKQTAYGASALRLKCGVCIMDAYVVGVALVFDVRPISGTNRMQNDAVIMYSKRWTTLDSEEMQ